MVKGVTVHYSSAGGMFEIRSNFGQLTKMLGMMASQVHEPMEKAGEEIVERVEKLYWPTYAMWEHQPDIKVKYKIAASPRRMDVRVWRPPPYLYVDEGTKARWIVAKNAPFLMWRWPFAAKTQQNVLGSWIGSIGSNWARMKRVWNPGIKPRNFTEKVVKNARPFMKQTIRDALQAWAERLAREYMG